MLDMKNALDDLHIKVSTESEEVFIVKSYRRTRLVFLFLVLFFAGGAALMPAIASGNVTKAPNAPVVIMLPGEPSPQPVKPKTPEEIMKEKEKEEEMAKAMDNAGMNALERLFFKATKETPTMSEFQRFMLGSPSEERLTDLRRFGADFFGQERLSATAGTPAQQRTSSPSSSSPAAGTPLELPGTAGAPFEAQPFRDASSPSDFDTTPVSPNYVVGPGDELRVTLWGMVEGSWNAVVNRQGTISLPRVGVLGVAGLTFSELQGLLESEFSKYFSNFEINVSLGALKSMKVYVTGHARTPGAYTISSLATLVNVLLSAGGPDDGGSMRRIEVKRNNRTLTTFDMYDFLLKGDKSKDIRMMPEDVVFIAPVGAQAAIAGGVQRPAIYELKGATSVADLVSMAGGMTSAATVDRIQLWRVVGRQFRTIFEGNLKQTSPASLRMEPVQDGDFVRIFSVVHRESKVSLTGPVLSPGEYFIQPGRTRLKDVIDNAGGLLPHAGDSAEITRVSPAPEGPKREHLLLSVARVMQGDPDQNIPLQENDAIFLRTVPEWTLSRYVEIRGEVRNPGVYPMHDGERLSSLIERAGGFTSRAYPRGGVFTRKSVREAQQKQVAEMVSRMERELLATGADEMSAVLTTEDAKIQEAEGRQKRQLLENLRRTQVAGRITTLIAPSAVLKGTPYDLPLEDGDAVYVPANPSTVQVLGSVLNPSAFIYDKRFSHTQYIRMAGGYSTEASPDRTYILKADGSAVRVKGASQSAAPWVKEYGEEKWQLVEPGDAIIVPMKVSSYKGLRQTRDYLDMFYKLAMTAAAIHNATK